MTLRDRWRRRRRRRRREKAAAENRNQPLREFVYLDEVSVFSLLASRIGALAAEFTDSESSSLASEVKAGGGLSSPVANASVSSGVKAEQASSTQVLRKSTIQSTFRELYDYVRDSLVLAPPASGGQPEFQHPLSDLLKTGETDPSWLIDASRLKRGELLEVEVELDADETFRLTTIMATLLELLDEMPELPETVDIEALVNTIVGTRLLNKLLVGLVPVRGKVIDYSFASVRDRELIVHNGLLEQQSEPHATQQPLYVVGVAEAGLFWRDIRRVLFSGARYRMLCRVGRDGLHPTWTPVKLMDVLEGAVPALRGAIDELPALLERMGTQEQPESQPQQLMRRALVRYAADVTSNYGHPMSTDDLAGRGLPTTEQCESYATVEARRSAFRSLTEVLAQELGFATEPEVLAVYRTNAWLEEILVASTSSIHTDQASTRGSEARSVRYLDCEIVAVYW